MAAAILDRRDDGRDVGNHLRPLFFSGDMIRAARQT
jgi:hypothetical protein